jgi:hypothetical protein
VHCYVCCVCRTCSLIPRSPIAFVEECKLISPIFAKAHWSIEADATAGSFYVLKDDTRVEGPWTDKDTVVTEELKSVWRQDTMNPVQAGIEWAISDMTGRQMLFINDPRGGSGKTTWGCQRAILGKALRIPAIMSVAEDVMHFVMGQLGAVKPYRGDRKLVIFDMPRATPKDRWMTYLSVFEDISNGHLYDKRYSARQQFVVPPLIVIFCNSWPPAYGLTSDRFRLYSVRQDGDGTSRLVKYNFDMVAEDQRLADEQAAIEAAEGDDEEIEYEVNDMPDFAANEPLPDTIADGLAAPAAQDVQLPVDADVEMPDEDDDEDLPEVDLDATVAQDEVDDALRAVAEARDDEAQLLRTEARRAREDSMMDDLELEPLDWSQPRQDTPRPPLARRRRYVYLLADPMVAYEVSD